MPFRPLKSNDYELYLSLINEFRPTTFTDDQFKETLQTMEKSSVIWVYEEGEQLLATGTIIYETKFIYNTCIYAHIEDICVRASHRRQGLGKKLVAHLIDQARHCYKITLDCADENIKFYESCGLERRGNQMCQLLKNL
jgi:glucosamine-phosphate N-acetyltransferase